MGVNVVYYSCNQYGYNYNGGGEKMQFSARLTMATHILLAADYFSGEVRTTSEFLAGSVGTNPVIVRRILGQLRNAGLITVEQGIGGVSLAKAPSEISLLDIYNAVEKKEDTIFHFHENPNEACPVGGRIHELLDGELERVTKCMEKELDDIKLSTLAEKIPKGKE